MSNGILPLAIVDQVVPLRDQVVDGTSRMRLAKRSPAIHTASRLDLAFHGSVVQFVALDGVQLAPVHDALQRTAVGFRITLVVNETAQLLDTVVRTVATLDPIGKKSSKKRVRSGYALVGTKVR